MITPTLPYDPVLRLLRGCLCPTVLRAVLWSVTINGAMLYGSGLILSLAYKGEAAFVSVLDFPEVYVAALVYWIYLPVVWALFVRQPDWVRGLVDSLKRNDIIGEAIGGRGRGSFDSHVEKLVMWFSHPLLVWLSTVTALSLGAVFLLIFSGVSGSLWSSPTPYWWRLNAYMGTLVLSLVVPLWSTHSAMKGERSLRLALVGKELDAAMMGLDGLSDGRGRAAASGHKVFALRQIYEVLEKTYPEWPLRLPLAQKAGLGIMAMVPPLTSAAITIASAFGLVPGK